MDHKIVEIVVTDVLASLVGILFGDSIRWRKKGSVTMSVLRFVAGLACIGLLLTYAHYWHLLSFL